MAIRRWFIAALLVAAAAPCPAMEMGTNFWNIQWGNAWHDYFAEGVNWSTTTNPWRQDFLSDMAPYTAIRYMDWVPTNGSTVRYWSSRIAKTANHYSTAGVAYEWQIDLCNRVGADLWITVPHLTVEDYEANPTSNYWVSLANLIKQQLDPNLNVYVEYSNETWNTGPGFSQGQYCQSRGLAAGYDPDGYTAGFYFHVYAAMRLHKVFMDVFSDQPWRVKKVIAGQASSDWGTRCEMLALQNSSINPLGLVPDFYSIAPYAGGGLNGASPTIRAEWTASVADSVNMVQGARNTMTQYYGSILPLALYESGQSLTNNGDVFARNPQSYDMYAEYLNAIDDNVVVAAHYTHTGTWASGGDWGAKESTWQTLADAHKYRAILDYANSHATEPPGQATVPGPADTATGVSVTTDLTWIGGRWAASHDVYFGTNPTPGPAEFHGNQTSVTFDPGALANSTTYYWRIDSVNPLGTNPGVVWSFTTEAPTIRIYCSADASSQSGDCSTASMSFSQYNIAFFKFDLSTLVPPLTSAKLRLRYQSSQILTIYIRNATTDVWTECVSVPGQGATQMASAYAPVAGWYEFDVNSFVDAEAAGDDLITFAVSSDYGGWTGLSSRHSAYPPELAIAQANPPPGLASNPSPANGATGLSINTDLSWTPGADATSHDVYFGTTSSPPFIRNQAEASFDPGTLSNSTTYYWRIDEKNAYGTTTGVVWHFTTFVVPPDQASNPNPSNSAINVSVTTDLSWTAGFGATSHDVYFGTTNPPQFRVNKTSTTYDTGTMVGYVTYYWRIDEKNTGGTTTGNLWSFMTGIPPGQATSPSPTNGATNVSRNADLTWTAGLYTTSHNVHFGTTAPPPLIQNQTSTKFDPGTMAAGTIYYWRIDECNALGLTTTGTQWQLTTGSDEGDGIVGQYFDNNDFTNHRLTRVDLAVSFNWTSGSPDPTIQPDTFSVRWFGLVQPRYSETYTFYTYTNDGVRLWVDGNLIIDKWFDQNSTPGWTGTAQLQAGEKYDIQMDYYDNVGIASAYLAWSSASQAMQTIPQGRLFTTFPLGDLNFDYYIDLADLGLFCDQWMTDPAVDPNSADFDDSNNVDFFDFALMGENWGL